MMKGKWYGVLTFFLISSLFGVHTEGQEVQTLEDLIASCERQLNVYKELRDLIEDFQKQQDRFHQGAQTKQLATQMVQTASKIYRLASDHHLLYLFTPFFIEELKLFSGIIKKTHPTP